MSKKEDMKILTDQIEYDGDIEKVKKAAGIKSSEAARAPLEAKSFLLFAAAGLALAAIVAIVFVFLPSAPANIADTGDEKSAGASYAGGDTTDGLKYEEITVNEGAPVRLFAVGGNGESVQNELVIPEYAKGQEVTAIMDEAFAGNPNITKVFIPAGIRYIGKEAFNGCTGLVEITVDDDNEYFRSINGDLYTKDGKALVQYAIGKPDEEVTVSDVSEIKSGAFGGCENIKVLNLGLVSKLNGFNGCVNLERVNYMGTLEQWCNIEIGIETPCMYSHNLYVTRFGKYEQVTNLYISGEIGQNTFMGLELNSIEISSPTSSTRRIIGMSAFAYCSGLKSVTIPDGVYLMPYAFFGCHDLKTVTVLGGNCLNGQYAFADCTSLEEVTIDGATRISNGVFFGCTALKEITVPDGVTYIGKEAFKGCTDLSAAYLGGRIKKIDKEAFFGCENLENVTFNGSLDELGDSCFSGCKMLKSVIIAGGAKSVGEYAFADCINLESVTLGDNTVRLAKGVFSGDVSLRSLTLGKKLRYVAEGAFDNLNSIESLYFSGTVADWCAVTFEYSDPDKDVKLLRKVQRFYINGELVENLVIPSWVEKVGDHAFAGYYRLKSVTVSEGVESIGDHAFADCIALGTVAISGSVKEIGRYAFKSDFVNDLTLSYGIEELGEGCFYECFGLKKVSLPDSLKIIGDSAFKMCYALEDIYIPEGVTKLGKCVFSFCIYLDFVVIPESVTDIAPLVFDGSFLTTVYYKGSKPQWEAVAEKVELDKISIAYYSEMAPAGGGERRDRRMVNQSTIMRLCRKPIADSLQPAVAF